MISLLENWIYPACISFSCNREVSWGGFSINFQAHDAYNQDEQKKVSDGWYFHWSRLVWIQCSWANFQLACTNVQSCISMWTTNEYKLLKIYRMHIYRDRFHSIKKYFTLLNCFYSQNQCLNGSNDHFLFLIPL